MALDTLNQIKVDLLASGHFAANTVDVALPNDDESHRESVTAKVFYESIAADDEHGELGEDEIVIRIDIKDASDAIEGQGQMAALNDIKVDNPGGYLAGDTSMDFDSTVGVKIGDFYQTASGEIIKVVSFTGSTIIMVRGAKGTTAAPVADNEIFTDLNTGIYAILVDYFKETYNYKAGGNYNAYMRVVNIGQLQPITTGSDANDVGRYFFEVNITTLRG